MRFLAALLFLAACGEPPPYSKACNRQHNRCVEHIPDRCGLTTSHDLLVPDVEKMECASAAEALCLIALEECLENAARGAR